MLHTNERIIKQKLGQLYLAEDLGNVSRACQVMGLSRHTFYRYKAAGGWRFVALKASPMQSNGNTQL